MRLNETVASSFGVCSVCDHRHVEVDVEVINLTANDVLSLQSCMICAIDISSRTWKPMLVDQDQLLFTYLGTIGGEDSN